MNVVCDASTLISLGETCTLNALRFLKSKSKTRFFVPPAVVYEAIQHPEHIRKYAFSGYKVQSFLDSGILEAVDDRNLASKTQEILKQSNNVFSVNGRPLKIIHAGEAECLAAYRDLDAKAVLVDEKTTRLFIEDPKLLKDSLQKEYRANVKVNQKALSALADLLDGITALRSTEVLAVAVEKGYFAGFGKNAVPAFQAALYALRNAGCSITTAELEEYGQTGY